MAEWTPEEQEYMALHRSLLSQPAGSPIPDRYITLRRKFMAQPASAPSEDVAVRQQAAETAHKIDAAQRMKRATTSPSARSASTRTATWNAR